MRAEIIIIGGNHHNTLGVIRSLGRRGINSDVILITSDKNPFVGKSRYINTLQILTDRKDALDVLLLHEHEALIPIIACSDQDALFLDINKEKLKGKYYLPVTSSCEGLKYWMNKNAMSELAESVGLSVPQYYYISTTDSSIEYPVIVKPLKSVDGSKKDIKICENKTDLDEFLSGKQINNIQVQSFIKKKFEFQLIGCSIDSGKEVIIPGYSKIIRQPNNTNTGFLSYHRLDNTFPIKECTEFLRRVSYSGLFSMEFLRGEDGKDYFMEINFRNDGNAICVTAAGVNLPFIWYAANMGLNYDEEASSPVHDVLVMPEFDDFLTNVVHKKISLKTWVRDLRRTDCFMEYSSDDKAPFFSRLKFEVERLFKKCFYC